MQSMPATHSFGFGNAHACELYRDRPTDWRSESDAAAALWRMRNTWMRGAGAVIPLAFTLPPTRGAVARRQRSEKGMRTHKVGTSICQVALPPYGQIALLQSARLQTVLPIVGFALRRLSPGASELLPPQSRQET